MTSSCDVDIFHIPEPFCGENSDSQLKGAVMHSLGDFLMLSITNCWKSYRVAGNCRRLYTLRFDVHDFIVLYCIWLTWDKVKQQRAINSTRPDVLPLFLYLVSAWWMINYNGVIMGTMAFQITGLAIVYSAVYSGADQRKHQSSALLAFVWGIHRPPSNAPHKWPVTRKIFPFDDVIMWRQTYCSICWGIFLSVFKDRHGLCHAKCVHCNH